MVQKTKQQRSQDSEQETTTSEADTSRSQEVVEGATCCLTNIDDLLNDMDAVLPDPEEETVEEAKALPAWHPDAEYDPMDDRPSMPSMAEFMAWWDENRSEEDSDAMWNFYHEVESAHDERTEEWHDLRGLSMGRVKSTRGGCVC